jgi:hypothetical protein
VSPTHVLCPLCKRRWLHATVGGALLCTCGFRLDTARGIGAEQLEARLAEAFEAHRAGGCGADLGFELRGAGSSAVLFSTCTTCGHCAVVL